MLQFKILTLFPDIFTSFLSQSLLQKALEANILEVETINYRDYGIGKHRKVDDTPYGGGAGMVLRTEPIYHALQACENKAPNQKIHKVLISPQGTPFNQAKARELSQLTDPIAFVCGRFEGFDERIRSFVDEEISIGDFVLLGGETAAMVMIEAIGRLVPGVIGNQDSLDNESFSDGLLEYSQYTRPVEFQGAAVPEVLLSGNHQKIEEWRFNDSLEKTKRVRPDLYRRYLEERES